MYTYSPDAEDELSFELNDVITEAFIVGEGWLYGTNERTQLQGLVPEPYFTKI